MARLPRGAAHRHVVVVDRVELRRPELGSDGDSHRPGAAAQVDHNWAETARRAGDGLFHQVLGATPRDEHPSLDIDPHPAEVDPAEYVLERCARDSSFNQGSDVRASAARSEDQPRLVVGEHAASCRQPRRDGGEQRRVRGFGQYAPSERNTARTVLSKIATSCTIDQLST